MDEVLAAMAMLVLQKEERDAAIASSPGVLDLRPRLHHRLKQRELTKALRKP